MINLSNIKMSHGDRVLFKNENFLINEGEKIGLVGPNGAGKTTVFRLIMGEEHPDEGTVSILPGKVVGYFSQDVGEMTGKTALEEVLSGAGRIFEIGKQLSDLEHRMADPEGEGLTDEEMDRYGELQMKFQSRGGDELESNAETILDGLGIGRDRWGLPVDIFSGGWKMRIALAKILLLNPDVLLIDEPTNHLDIASREVLLEALTDFEGTIMIVSHDRYFLKHLVNRVYEIDHGQMKVFEGDYNYYLEKTGH